MSVNLLISFQRSKRRKWPPGKQLRSKISHSSESDCNRKRNLVFKNYMRTGPEVSGRAQCKLNIFKSLPTRREDTCWPYSNLPTVVAVLRQLGILHGMSRPPTLPLVLSGFLCISFHHSCTETPQCRAPDFCKKPHKGTNQIPHLALEAHCLLNVCHSFRKVFVLGRQG